MKHRLNESSIFLSEKIFIIIHSNIIIIHYNILVFFSVLVKVEKEVSNYKDRCMAE